MLTGLRITRYQWFGASEVQESQDDTTGPTAHLELGTPWIGETLFKLHPSQTQGRYDGIQTKDYSPLEPSGTAVQPRPLPGPEEPCQRGGRTTHPDTSTIQDMVSSMCGSEGYRITTLPTEGQTTNHSA